MITRWIAVIVALAMLLLAAVLPNRASGFSAAREREVRVLMWSDYIDPDLVKDFEKTANTKVIIDVYEETESMLAKLQAGGDAQYDLIVASDHAVPVLAKLGLLAKLDRAQIPNAVNVDKRFNNPPYDPKGEYAIPYQWGTVGILYNKEKLPNFAASWAEVFGGDPKGRFLMLDSNRDTLGAALRASGKSVNATDVADVRAAGIKVLAAKEHKNFVGFDGSVGAAKKVVTGQADFALVYNGDALNAIREAGDEGKKFEYVVPDEGSIIWVDTMVVPARAKDRAAAHQFINYLLDGPTGAKLSNYIQFATPNAASLPAIEESARKDPRIYPPEELIKKLEYLEDLGQNTRLYDEVWTAIKAR